MAFNRLNAYNPRPYVVNNGSLDLMRRRQEDEEKSKARETFEEERREAQKEAVHERTRAKEKEARANEKKAQAQQESQHQTSTPATNSITTPQTTRGAVSVSELATRNSQAATVSTESLNAINSPINLNYSMGAVSGYGNSINPVKINTQQSQIITNPIANSSAIAPINSTQVTQTSSTSEITATNIDPRNDHINIAQILKDFKNTAAAIGTPDELNAEVNDYIDIIYKQTQKEEPNGKLIKSNLKNASSILDNYISQTLEKESKVVENWVDALFLQKINFKFNEDEINAQFLVKFPENSKKAQESQSENSTNNSEEVTTSSENSKSYVSIPTDTTLKSLFLQAKKYAYTDNPKEALSTFKQALNRANEIEDSETAAKIKYEIGKVYDQNDYLSKALTSYNQSIETTSDNNLKTQAHFSMAQIYDDVQQIDTAIEHYFTSVAYAGESDNLKAQSTSMTKLGNIFADKYNENAFEYFNEANTLANETTDSKLKGYVSSNTAIAYDKFNQPQSALKYYSSAAKNYTEADSPAQTAKNYQRAAIVMKDYGNTQKAKSLLQKAVISAQESGDKDLLSSINADLREVQ